VAFEYPKDGDDRQGAGKFPIKGNLSKIGRFSPFLGEKVGEGRKGDFNRAEVTKPPGIVASATRISLRISLFLGMLWSTRWANFGQ
jgi:hypothetical protein